MTETQTAEKWMILRTRQEDIDAGSHSASLCPVAKGLSLATGLRATATQIDGHVRDNGQEWVIPWPHSFIETWIYAYDDCDTVDPFEGIIAVPADMPVLPGYLVTCTCQDGAGCRVHDCPLLNAPA
jgi:hypothetical protein